MAPTRSPITVRHVAARAGVAMSTVSKVLNRPDSVMPATYASVTAAIEELGYVRNEAARSLRLGDSHAVGLLLSQAKSPFASELAEAAGAVFTTGDFAALLGDSALNVTAEQNLIKLFGAQHVRGLLINPISQRPHGLDALESRGVAVVYLDARAPSSERCSVRVDDEMGGNLAISHLAAIGKRHVAVVRGRLELPQAQDRLRGARTAAKAAGVRLTEITTAGYSVEDGLEAGAIIASRPRESMPDAVFAINDPLAMGVVSSLIDRGIDIPRDIAVVGYDDISYAAVARRPLTTVRQPAREVGARAAALLVEEMTPTGPHEHEQTVFTPELVIRSSTVAS